MDTSKSVIIKQFGGYDAISVEEYPLPPLEGLVEIKVEYASLNFSDIIIRQGFLYDRALPMILGLECTGTITAIGCKGSNFHVGEHVICYDFEGGIFRDVIRVKPEKCYILPDHIGFKEGAAIFSSYITAYLSVLELGALKPNQSVFIQSCAGGVGWAATQLARTVENVKIYGVVSRGKENFVKNNGVDLVFTYENLEENLDKVGGFDLIIINQAGLEIKKYQQKLNPLGRLILLGISNFIKNEQKLSLFDFIKIWWQTKYINPADLVINNIAVCGIHLGTFISKNEEKVRIILNGLFDFMKDGKILPKIDSVWCMEEITEATKMLIERRNVGKVLLAVNGPKA